MDNKIKMLLTLVLLGFLTLGCISQPEETPTPTTAPPTTAPPTTAPPTTAPPPEEKIAVAIVFATGGLGDKSFNDTCYEGIKKAQEDFEIEFDYVEPTAIAEYEGFHRQYAKSGDYNLIIGIGFDQADAMTIVAEEYPEQKFAIVDMVVDLPNVASLIFRENEGGFLIGIAAGLKTETDKIGFVGGMDIPLIRKFLAGYKYGAEYVNPDIEVSWKYVENWTDPAKGKELALAQFDAGADILFVAAGRSGLGAIQAAYEQNHLVIGVDADQCDTIEGVPVTTFLCSMLKRVDVAVYETIKDVVNGEFQGGIYSFGVAENGVGVCEHLPDDLQDEIEEYAQMIADDEIVIPTGIDENGDYTYD
ncbi:MAG: BMP family ABC transporter substrate-binding protein [Candidatus Methanofastidiosia archaeon]|jgi:basic membrane protein A